MLVDDNIEFYKDEQIENLNIIRKFYLGKVR